MDGTGIIVWLVSLVVAAVIGEAKGRVGSGLVWGFLLGPIGVLIVAVLPNLKKEKEDKECREVEEQRRNQHELERLQLMQGALRGERPQPRPDMSYRVSCRGKDMGELPAPTIKLMLKTGQIGPSDFYFDPLRNDWLTLDKWPES